jgi:cysteine desulfurase
LPNSINICFGSQGVTLGNAPKVKPLDSEFLVIKLDTLGFAVSAASACHTLSLENGSYVIESLGKPECSGSSLRITFGRETKKSDVDSFIIALKKILC